MTIRDLMDERGRLLTQASEMLKLAEQEKRDLTGDEQAKFDQLVDEAKRKQDMIDRMATLSTLQSAVHGAPVATAAQASQDVSMRAFDAFVRRGEIEQRALAAGSGSGSYLVPTEMHNEIITALAETNWARQVVTVIQTGNNREIPIGTARPTVAYASEGGSISAADPTITQKTLGAHKLTALTVVSRELLDDAAFDVASFLSQQFGEAFGEKELEMVLIGTGSGQPRGATVDATVSVTGSTTTSTPGYDDIIEMYSDLKSQYHSGAIWTMNQAVFGAILKLKDSQNRPIFQIVPSENAIGTILGRPVRLASAMPSPAASKRTVLFWNPRYYLLGLRGGFELQRLNELYATNGQVGFLATMRHDGVLTLAEAAVCYANPAS